MELLKHYENLLAMARLRLDDSGMVHRLANGEGKITNLFVQTKPVVMPIYKQLASADISERLVFHPFAESAAKGESVIVAELRSRFCHTIGLSLSAFFTRCLELAASKAEHSKLNPIQAEMLDALRKIEIENAAAIVGLFVKLLKSPEKKTAAMVQIYLTRNGKVGEKEYARAGIVSFPLYSAVLTELEKTKDRSIEGIPMSEKNLVYIKGLFEYVFPLLKTDPTGYNQGSNSEVAPYMDALMKTTAAVVGMVNERIKLFENILNKDGDDAGLKPLPEDWMSAIDELGSLLPEIIKIPLQPGMDGQARVSETLAAANQMVAGPAAPQVVQQPVYQQQQPQQYPPGVLVPTGYAPAPVQQPVYQQQPIQQNPYQPQPQVYYQPQYYQQQQPVYAGPQPVYGTQPMGGTTVNLNPYVTPQQPNVFMGNAPQSKGMWD